jgi:hypothetical protein
MAIRKKTKIETIGNKTLHRKLKIKQDFFLFVIFIFSGVVKLDYSCDFPLHNKQIICQ